MRVETVERGYRIVLSKRNLLALLTKLDFADSACTILTIDTDNRAFFVSSEPDDQHYVSRIPGRMHPITEVAIRRSIL